MIFNYFCFKALFKRGNQNINLDVDRRTDPKKIKKTKRLKEGIRKQLKEGISIAMQGGKNKWSKRKRRESGGRR